MTSIVWFRRDLRLENNLALQKAFEAKEPLLLLFQVNPKQFLDKSHNQQAFFQSVSFFQNEVNQSLHLQVLYGELEECFERLKKKVPDWNTIYFNSDNAGYGKERDEAAKEFFSKNKITYHEFSDHYLHEANEILKDSQEHYKVFTPYYKKWIKKEKPVLPEVSIQQELVEKGSLFSKDEAQFATLVADLPEKPLYEHGTDKAIQHLQTFLKKIHKYDTDRDIPSIEGTSKLSFYLRTGELSVKRIWHELKHVKSSDGKDTFIQELCWRDFYHMIYTENPQQKDQAIQPAFSHITWKNEKDKFQQWKEGQTGFPIVDAGMRQLKETGWLHNRLRMVVASFLTKDLLIDWRWGEGYFQQELIDYDPASNIGGWQWAASTGTDAVPYFRIFNPARQSERFDPKGEFIRKFVPELKDVPKEWIHQPENMDEATQNKYNIKIGSDYPEPIVNHNEARKEAIARYKESKEWYTEHES